MTAVRLLSREEMQERLKEFGCTLVEEVNDVPDPYYRASYWRSAWGFHFYIPEIGPDRLCPEHRFYEVLAELAQQAAQRNG